MIRSNKVLHITKRTALLMENSSKPEVAEQMANKRWWLSFYVDEDHGWLIESPWWISGYGENTNIVVVAMVATTEDEAKDKVLSGIDEGAKFEWRFVIEKENDWSPFGDRFQRADWMEWPS